MTDLERLLADIHPALPAAIGHAMCFAVEDEAGDDMQLLVEPCLRSAAEAFFTHAQRFASQHPNILPDEDDDSDEDENDDWDDDEGDS